MKNPCFCHTCFVFIYLILIINFKKPSFKGHTKFNSKLSMVSCDKKGCPHKILCNYKRKFMILTLQNDAKTYQIDAVCQNVFCLCHNIF